MAVVDVQCPECGSHAVMRYGRQANGSCSQIVDSVELDRSLELVAIHKESDDGVMQDDRFRETNCFAS